MRFGPSQDSSDMCCPEHRKRLEGYCSDCHEFVCFDCTISLHSGHRIGSIPSMTATYKSIWERDLQELFQLLGGLNAAVDKLDVCDQDIVRQGTRMETEIHRIASEVIARVLQAEEHMKEDVKSIVKKRRAVIGFQKKK